LADVESGVHVVAHPALLRAAVALREVPLVAGGVARIHLRTVLGVALASDALGLLAVRDDDRTTVLRLARLPARGRSALARGGLGLGLVVAHGDLRLPACRPDSH